MKRDDDRRQKHNPRKNGTARRRRQTTARSKPTMTEDARLTKEVPKEEMHELRLEVLLECDDAYRTQVVTQAVEELRAVNDSRDDEDTLVYTLGTANTWLEAEGDTLTFATDQPDELDNERALEQLPMMVLNSDFWESDTYDSTRVLAQVLYDSGKQLREIEAFLGEELADAVTTV